MDVSYLSAHARLLWSVERITVVRMETERKVMLQSGSRTCIFTEKFVRVAAERGDKK